MLYVYRRAQSRGFGHPEEDRQSLIYVNGYLVNPLHNSEYVAMEVPEGTVAVAATPAEWSYFKFPSTGDWASLPGCAVLDWRRLATASPRDIELCKAGLNELNTKCGIYETTLGAGPARVVITHVPDCNYKLAGSGLSSLQSIRPRGPYSGQYAPGLLNYALTPPSVRLQIEAEAGKTYCVKWFIGGSFGSGNTWMTMVDPKTGDKEMRGLKPAN